MKHLTRQCISVLSLERGRKKHDISFSCLGLIRCLGPLGLVS